MMEMSKGTVINVHFEEGKIIHFKAYAQGIFCINLSDPTIITNPDNVSLEAYSYLSTLKQNSECFTDSEIEGAQKFQKLQ